MQLTDSKIQCKFNKKTKIRKKTEKETFSVFSRKLSFRLHRECNTKAACQQIAELTKSAA